MADLLLEGIPVLDLLEITSSTTAVARRLQRDQSSISRIYRHVSQVLNLDFQKQSNGFYQAQSNQLLLASLRLASQQMRLALMPSQLRWLHALDEPLLLADLSLRLPPALPLAGSPQPERLAALLEGRLLDLVLLSEPPLLPASRALISRPVAGERIHALLRQDLIQTPAIQQVLDLQSP